MAKTRLLHPQTHAHQSTDFFNVNSLPVNDWWVQVAPVSTNALGLCTISITHTHTCTQSLGTLTLTLRCYYPQGNQVCLSWAVEFVFVTEFL